MVKVDKTVEELAQQKLKELFTPVNLRDVVTLDRKGGIIYIGGVRADDSRLQNLHAEAEFFVESDLWRVINETAKQLAQMSMFVAGDSIEDMKKGRAVLFTLDSQRKIVEVFKNYIKK